MKKLFTLTILFLILSSLFANQFEIPKGQFNRKPQIQRFQKNPDGAVLRELDIYSDDFENAVNWSNNGLWEVGIPMVGPETAHSSLNCAGTNLDGFYQNNSAYLLRSETIELPPASIITLSFQEWFSIESGYDHGFVMLSTNGGSSWIELDERSGTSGDEWEPCQIDISSYNNRDVIIGFKLVSDSTVPGFGWYIDDFAITGEEPDILNVNILDLNSQNFPFVYMNVNIDSLGSTVTSLEEDDFSIYENSVEQSDFVEIIFPEEEDRSRMADIVFVLDVSGSMGDEINSVRQNMQSFVNSLTQSQIDYRIGFIVFADIYYVYNEHNLYEDSDDILSVINNIQLGEHGLGNGGDGPENQFGSMAEACLMNFRPGSQRIQIMLTDATSHENDGVTPWTLDNLLAERLIPNQIVVFPIFDNNSSAQIDQYVQIAEMTNPLGTYYHIYDNFNEIITDIGNFVANNFSVRYRSNDEELNGLTRIVEVIVEKDNETATGTGFYMPGSNPEISLTEYTANMLLNSQSAGNNLELEINILDAIPPYAISVNLFYKQVGADSYLITPFSESAQGTWAATIPSAHVQEPGLSYYISASDGQTISTYPALDPFSNYYTIAVGSNELPQVSHTVPESYTPNTNISISANITDATTSITTAELHFRRYGELSFQNVNMTSSGSNYTGVIPSDYASNIGIEYFILGRDNFGIAGYSGDIEDPHAIIIAPELVSNHEEAIQMVSDFSCYPNPFNNKGQRSTVNIKFSMKTPQKAKIDIYNVRGQIIHSVPVQEYAKGENSVFWNSTDKFGQSVSTGIYFIKLESNRDVVTSKVTIIK